MTWYEIHPGYWANLEHADEIFIKDQPNLGAEPACIIRRQGLPLAGGAVDPDRVPGLVELLSNPCDTAPAKIVYSSLAVLQGPGASSNSEIPELVLPSNIAGAADIPFGSTVLIAVDEQGTIHLKLSALPEPLPH